MTPAALREAAAVLVEERPIRLMTEVECIEARASLAAAIRALPLAEEALTPREKLRRVDDMRLATEWSGTVRRVGRYQRSGMVLGEWWPSATRENLDAWDAVTDGKITPHPSREAARAWVLDTLRAEGWDVVEEGEGDG